MNIISARIGAKPVSADLRGARTIDTYKVLTWGEGVPESSGTSANDSFTARAGRRR